MAANIGIQLNVASGSTQVTVTGVSGEIRADALQLGDRIAGRQLEETRSAVNIVTRTGGNRLRGEILEIWRPAATEAALSGFNSTNAATGNDVSSNTLGLSDVSLGGPLGRGNLTHFFSDANSSAKTARLPSLRPSRPAASWATTAAGSASCGSTAS